MSSGGDGYPPILSLFKSVVITLTYLWRHHVQQELAEFYGVSQSTISRAITAITLWLARAMHPFTPTAQELPSDEQLIVDGTLVSCWSWEDHPELYSGKHHTTGLNLQVVCDLAGQLRWISDPVEGCRHDSAALRRSGVLDGVDTQNWIGDKGYLGLRTPDTVRKLVQYRAAELANASADISKSAGQATAVGADTRQMPSAAFHQFSHSRVPRPQR
jgi:hypothetical protein